MIRIAFLFLFIIIAGQTRADQAIVTIRSDFAGGNVLVTGFEGNRISIEPDLRGDRPWFYWLFEATATRAGEVEFVLPEKVIGHKNGAIGMQGPAISVDRGKTWQWMGLNPVTENRFHYTFEREGETVRFGVTIPYTTSDLSKFLAKHQANPHLKVTELTRSANDRPVELLHIGNRDASRRAFIVTARHHAAETMANYLVEGFLEEAISPSSEAGKQFRERFFLCCVPLVDKDGVEKGDQGKNRKPHDHNRDYTDTPIYPEVRAIQELHQRERFAYALDIHCPTLVYPDHQVMYFVGAKIHPPKNYEKVQAFSKEITSRFPGNAPHGPLVWLRDEIRISPKNSRWFAFQKGIVMSATLEVPFAPKGKAAGVDDLREYGRAILRAFVATPFEEIGPAQRGDLKIPGQSPE